MSDQPSFLSGKLLLAVKKITGIGLVLELPLIALTNVIPSSRGIMMSTMMRSGTSFSSIVSPARPSSHATTS